MIRSVANRIFQPYAERPRFSSASPSARSARSATRPGRCPSARRRRRCRLKVRGSKISKICKFLAGSFSAVSKRNFERKYAFDSIFQAVQDLHTFAPLQSQNFRKKNRFEKSEFFVKIPQNFANVAKFAKICQISKFQLDNLVDFEKCCKTHIFLQKSVPIQP